MLETLASPMHLVVPSFPSPLLVAAEVTTLCSVQARREKGACTGEPSSLAPSQGRPSSAGKRFCWYRSWHGL